MNRLKKDLHLLVFCMVLSLSCLRLAVGPTPRTTCRGSLLDICVSRDQLGCTCTDHVIDRYTASCRVKNVVNIHEYIMDTTCIDQLNLSKNNIQEIPYNSFRNFTELLYLNLAENIVQEITRGTFSSLKKLVYLSLASNRLQYIRQGAFHGLTKLRELNLRGNNIQLWDTRFLKQDVPNLHQLDIAENVFWSPDEQVLSLAHLRVVTLIVSQPLLTYNSIKLRLRCYLIKKNESVDQKDYSYVKSLPAPLHWKGYRQLKANKVYYYDKERSSFEFVIRNESYINVIADKGFHSYCNFLLSSRDVTSKDSAMKLNSSRWFHLVISYPCWNTTSRIHVISFLLGLLALGMNTIVVLTTLGSRVLRESVAHVLVANVAVGDLLVSFYLIILIATRQSITREQFDHLWHWSYYCNFIGFLALTGQFSSSILSFLITLERYLAVVYCMKSQLRITMTICRVTMAMAWCLSISLAVSFMTSRQFSKRFSEMCLPVSSIRGHPVIEYVAGLGSILYVISIALYGHIYVNAKRTNERSVQQRTESKLAKRIALIVLSNIFFYIISFAAILIVFFSPLKRHIPSRTKFIFRNTFAVICIGINSCLNPILFSFRNDKFRSQFRKMQRCFLKPNSVANEIS